MNRYNFLYTTDKNYFPHMYTSLISLVMSQGKIPLTVHIIYDGLTDTEFSKLDDLQKLYPNLEIKIYAIDTISQYIKDFNVPEWRETNIANARLFISELLPDVKKIFYIDSDTIVQGVLTQAFDNDNNVLSAVKDMYVPSHIETQLEDYYNSGVLLINLDKIRNGDYYERLANTLETKRKYLIYPDQDLLNLAYDKEINTLGINYNVYPTIYDLMRYPRLAQHYIEKNPHYYSYEEMSKALNDIKIFHFYQVFSGRPWDDNTINPFDKVYENYRLLWDDNFVKEHNSNLVCRMKCAPFISSLATAYLPMKPDYPGELKRQLQMKFNVNK